MLDQNRPWAALAGRAKAFVVGAVAALVMSAVAAAPAQARWLRAESPHFIVYGDTNQSTLTTYVEQLEGFDEFVRIMYGIKDDAVSPRKLAVYLVANHRELARAWPGAPEDIAGYYTAGIDDIYAIAIRESTDRGGKGDLSTEYRENTVFHEYTHHFMFQYLPHPYPAWLVEGYANYFGSAIIAKTYIDIGKGGFGETYELVNEPWLPLGDILSKGADYSNPAKARMFYAEAWLLTHYLLGDPERKKQLGAYLRALADGQDSVAAMTRATGKDPAALTKELKVYLKELKYTHFGLRRPFDAAKATIEVMPPSADALLLESLSLERGLRQEDRAAVVASIRAKAAGFKGDRLADLTLAHAEIEYGDRASGEAILDRRLAADPNDVDALVLAGQARLKDFDADPGLPTALAVKAQDYFAAAYKIDPERYQSLWLYVMIRRRIDADYPSDNTLEALLEAQALAPQVGEIRLEAAYALTRRKRWADAEAMLGPMLHDPHNEGAARAAQELLDRINAERTDKTASKASAGG